MGMHFSREFNKEEVMKQGKSGLRMSVNKKPTIKIT